MPKSRNFFYAVATIIGTIVGVGIFGLPYAFARAGFFLGLTQLILLGGVTMIIHLMFGEIILRTKEKHSLPGYIEKYLGKRWEVLVSFSVLLGIFGSMVAYILVGGAFLNTLLDGLMGGTNVFPQNYLYIIFWFFLTVLILLGLKTMEIVEFSMTIFLIIAVGVIALLSMPYVHMANLLSTNGFDAFMPYGVILFSLAGTVAIPEIREILSGNEKKIKAAIIVGIFVPIVIYALFAFIINGVTGVATSEEALSGLYKAVCGRIYIVGALFGIFAIVTSYITFGYYLYETFLYDYGISKTLSHLLIALVPIAFVLLGVRDFIAIIGFLGAVMGGFEGIAMILAYFKAKKMGDRTPEYSLKIPHAIYYFLIFIFVLGIIYTIVYGT